MKRLLAWMTEAPAEGLLQNQVLPIPRMDMSYFSFPKLYFVAFAFIILWLTIARALPRELSLSQVWTWPIFFFKKYILCDIIFLSLKKFLLQFIHFIYQL